MILFCVLHKNICFEIYITLNLYNVFTKKGNAKKRSRKNIIANWPKF